ncbi:unnamed protein product [Prorocentrum cordatum]|uniref:Uncharacterized protein n=1 Tax=Prorocentrum cordatum TaxID=2364126 RepID=A0ABN9RX78_9DINO|nr:unnamed protein product [Polarella glacialis]
MMPSLCRQVLSPTVDAERARRAGPVALAIALYALSEALLAGSIQMPEANYNWQTNILMVAVMAAAFRLGSASARAARAPKAGGAAKGPPPARRAAPERGRAAEPAPPGEARHRCRQEGPGAASGHAPRGSAGAGCPAPREGAAAEGPPEASEVAAALGLFEQILEGRPGYDCGALGMYTRRRLFKLMVENLDDARLRADGLRLLEAFQAHGIIPTNLAQNRVICAWRSKLPEHVMEYPGACGKSCHPVTAALRAATLLRTIRKGFTFDRARPLAPAG